MHQVADEVVLDAQVALVDIGHEWQLVHVLQDRAILVVHDATGAIAVGDAVDAAIAALGDLLAGEVELVRATKSIGAPWRRLSSGCTATLAPTKPIFSAGFTSFSAAATFTSEANDGVEVWITHSS